MMQTFAAQSFLVTRRNAARGQVSQHEVGGTPRHSVSNAVTMPLGMHSTLSSSISQTFDDSPFRIAAQ